MYWGQGMGGWGILLMSVSTLLFWALVIAGVVALVRYVGPAAPQRNVAAETATPQRLLAERFARGEIDEEEYRRRLAILGGAAKTGAGG